LRYNFIVDMRLNHGKESYMKIIAILVFIGALLAFPVKPGYSESLAEWLIEAGGKPPVVTQWFAVKEVSHGDNWRIYVEANDPDGDMRRFVCGLHQVGYGDYPSQYVVIKKQHRGTLKGYLNFITSAGAGLSLPEWTEFTLTVYIQDKGGNTGNKLSFPLVLSRLKKQESPPSPFDTGGLDKLGTVAFELVNPQWDDGVERVP
jgi:hypothetical protein